MQYGLYLNSQAPGGGSGPALAEELVALTAAGRDAGFDLLSTGHGYLTDYCQLQQVPLLARLAAEAGDMTLVTGIHLLPLRNPVAFAEEIATLDAVARGDVIAGVGAGYRDVEFEAFQVPNAERGARLREGVEVANRLWTESAVTHDGEFYHLSGGSLDPRPAAKPPVWIGANATVAIERAARVGDAWLVNPHSTITEIREQKRVYDRIRAEMGASTSVPLMRETFVAPTREQARARTREALRRKYDRYVEWGQNEAMADATEFDQRFDELAEDRFLLGTPAEVRRELRRYETELDVSHVLMRVRWPGMKRAHVRECVELLGDEVVGRV